MLEFRDHFWGRWFFYELEEAEGMVWEWFKCFTFIMSLLIWWEAELKGWWVTGSDCKYRGTFAASPAAHLLLCSLFLNMPWTIICSQPRGWGPLITYKPRFRKHFYQRTVDGSHWTYLTQQFVVTAVVILRLSQGALKRWEQSPQGREATPLKSAAGTMCLFSAGSF